MPGQTWGQLIAVLSETVVRQGCIPGRLDRRDQKKLFIGAFCCKPDSTLDQLEYLERSLNIIVLF